MFSRRRKESQEKDILEDSDPIYEADPTTYRINTFLDLCKEFPEVDKLVGDALTNKRELFFKRNDHSIVSCKPFGLIDILEGTPEPEDLFYELDVRYDNGILKCGLQLYSNKDSKYLNKQIPSIRYIPEFFPYDSYKKTWSDSRTDL